MEKAYAVAICDILGFSNLVRRHSAGAIVEKSLNWFLKVLGFSLQREEFPPNVPAPEELRHHPKLGTAMFSDTLLLFTREDTEECLQALTSTVAWLLFMTMPCPDLRLRCGISYGNACIDPMNSIYVGKAILQAHKLEKAQVWSGGALTLGAVQHIPKKALKLPYDWCLVEYDVPLKGGQLRTYAIDWTIGLHLPKTDIVWSARNERPTSQDLQGQGSVCEKWQNTKAFHDRVCRSCGHPYEKR